jgi:uroporphyrin-III C-methyltransferase
MPLANAVNAAFVAAVAQAPVVQPRLSSSWGLGLEFAMTNLYNPCKYRSNRFGPVFVAKSARPAAQDWPDAAKSGSGFARLDQEIFPDFAPGSVWLVGAGPGAPGLLSLLAYHALQCCDVIVYDALVNVAILGWARPGAEIEYAGKRGGKPSPRQRDISLRLIELARRGKRVLRLKGGDPFIFGRGGEEAGQIARAGVPFRIVPGITAGVGGLAYAGIPATHRDVNQSVLFLTGHDATGAMPANVDWKAVARASPVIVMYMALKHLEDIARALVNGGREADDTVMIVSNATLPRQEVHQTTLGGMSEYLASFSPPTPAIVVVGRLSGWRETLDWYGKALRENKIG